MKAVNEIIEDNGNKKFTYMKMEYCGCGDLQSYVKKHYSDKNPMPVKDLEIVFVQLLQSIFHVHDKRLAHRDLKPENILIKQVEPFIWIKLCDFGCARITDKVMVTQHVGTPITNHPDVASGNYSSATELYSLGIIMYIVIYTYHPFKGCRDQMEIFEKARKGDIYYPELGEEYVPFIELTKGLIALGTQNLRVSSKNKQNFEAYWENCKNHSISKRFMKAANEAFDQHIPKSKQ